MACSGSGTCDSAETWVPIDSAPGYEVSDHGRVRSLPRVVAKKNGQIQPWRGCIRKLRTKPDGYVAVGLLGRTRYVHLLVLEAFVGPAPSGMECCHGNDLRGDNHLSNLRWGTKSENARDMVRGGSHPMSRRTRCPRNHPLAAPNLVASVLARRGFRSCLACDRATKEVTRKRKAGIEVDLHELADRYYTQILKES